jgi:hypothetical protein
MSNKKSNKPKMGKLQQAPFLPETTKALNRIGWGHGCGPAWTDFANGLERQLMVLRASRQAVIEQEQTSRNEANRLRASIQAATRLSGVTSTGWFGIPGREGGKVHAVFNKRPICGMRVDPRAEYQWCSHGLHWGYLECEGCKREALARLTHEIEKSH